MEVKVTIQSKALSKEEVRLLLQSIRDCEIPLLCAVFPQYHQYLVNPLPVSPAQTSY